MTQPPRGSFERVVQELAMTGYVKKSDDPVDVARKLLKDETAKVIWRTAFGSCFHPGTGPRAWFAREAVLSYYACSDGDTNNTCALSAAMLSFMSRSRKARPKKSKKKAPRASRKSPSFPDDNDEEP